MHVLSEFCSVKCIYTKQGCCFALELVYYMSSMWKNCLHGRWFAPVCLDGVWVHYIALHHAHSGYVKCRTPCSYRSFESLNMENDFILSVHFYVTDSTLTAMIGDNTNSSFDEIHHVFIMKCLLNLRCNFFSLTSMKFAKIRQKFA